MSDDAEPEPDRYREALVPQDEALLRYADSVRALVDAGLLCFPLRMKIRDAEPGAFIREARDLLEHAQEVMAAAVVTERERGASWSEVGEAFGGIARQTAQERWRDVMALWAVSDRTHRGGSPVFRLHGLALAEELDAWYARLQPDPQFPTAHAVTAGLAAGAGGNELDRRAANANRTEARRLRREIDTWLHTAAHDAYLDALEARKPEAEAREAWARPYEQLADLHERLAKVEPAHAESHLHDARQVRARAARIREAGVLDPPAAVSEPGTPGDGDS